MKKILIASTTALLCTLTAASLVTAQNTGTSTQPAVVAVTNENEIKTLQANIVKLQAEYDKLKAAVAAGTMTKADAQIAWKKLIADTRTQKKTVFEKRITEITTRYQKLQEKRPEIAAVVQEKVDMLQQKRQEAEAARADIQAKLKAGTISAAEAEAMRKSIVEQGKEKMQDIQATIKTKREEISATLAEKKVIKSEADAKIKELKNIAASGTPETKLKVKGEIKKIIDQTKVRFEEKREKIEGKRDGTTAQTAPRPEPLSGQVPVDSGSASVQ